MAADGHDPHGASADAPNHAQARFWNEDGGPSWVSKERMYEQMLEPFDRALLDALRPVTEERVLDIGCGFGTTSLSIASRGAPVLGVDISAPMIERARERAAAAGVDARFVVGDAQTDPLDGPHDAVVSRFGVMFFSDPVQAFANIGDSVVDGGRLAFVCWQPMESNPWMTLPTDVVRGLLDGSSDATPAPAPAAAPIAAMPGPNPFAFGDAGFVRQLLADAGWHDIDVATCAPVIAMGGDDGLAGAVEQALNGTAVKSLLAGGDASIRDRAAAILVDRFEPHLVDGVVRMPSAAWLVTARRRPR